MVTIESKFILDLSNKEILTEMYEIMGNKIDLPGRDTIGFITKNKNDYFQNGIVNEKKLRDVYNRNDETIKKYIMTLSINSLRNRKKDLFKLIRNQKSGNIILDYGCGVGTHAIACAQLGCEVHIMDISEQMLNICKSRFGRRNLKYYVHNRDRTIQYNYFDTILCTDVIEHIPTPDIMLKNFIKFLKIGGIAHLHISPHVCYERGHLRQAIEIWNGKCQKILEKYFEKISENNWRLVRK